VYDTFVSGPVSQLAPGFPPTGHLWHPIIDQFIGKPPNEYDQALLSYNSKFYKPGGPIGNQAGSYASNLLPINQAIIQYPDFNLNQYGYIAGTKNAYGIVFSKVLNTDTGLVDVIINRFTDAEVNITGWLTNPLKTLAGGIALGAKALVTDVVGPLLCALAPEITIAGAVGQVSGGATGNTIAHGAKVVNDLCGNNDEVAVDTSNSSSFPFGLVIGGAAVLMALMLSR
jgi:hypothetical protein